MKQISIPLPLVAHARAFAMKGEGKAKSRDNALQEMIRAAMEQDPIPGFIKSFSPSENVRENSSIKVPDQMHEQVMRLCGKRNGYDRSGYTLKAMYEYLLKTGAELV